MTKNIKITVKINIEDALWDNYVKRKQGATFYHLSSWKNLLVKSYNIKPYYLAAIDELNNVRGILGLFLCRGGFLFLKKHLVSGTLSGYCQELVDSEYVHKTLYNYAADLVHKLKIEYLEVRSLAPFKEDHFKTLQNKYCIFLLDLSKDISTLWNNLEPNLKNAIRKAKKNNLSISFDKKEEDIKKFYKMFALSMHTYHSTPVYGYNFFKNLLDIENTYLLTIRLKDEVIAGLVMCALNKYISIPYAMMNHKYKHLQPFSLMKWSAIKYSKQLGMLWCDFGRSLIGSSSYIYKQRFGAQQINLFYNYYFSNYLQNKELPYIHPSNPKYAKLKKLWRLLPLPLAELLGPKIIHHLA